MRTLLFISAFLAQVGFLDPVTVSRINRPTFPEVPPAEFFGGLVGTNGLVAYWDLDEASAGSIPVTRMDSWSTNHLTDMSAFCAGGTGKIGVAVNIENSSTEWLSTVTDNESLSMPAGSSFTLTCWVNFETSSGIRAILSKGTNSSFPEFAMWGNSSINFRGILSDGATVVGNVTNSTAPSNGAWFFVAMRFDNPGNAIRLRVNANNGPVATYTGECFDGNSQFEIGRATYNNALEMDGSIDEVVVWTRHLTDAELDALYNGGAGRPLQSP